PSERAAAFEGETVALATPNMLGDFLGSTALRCVQFQQTTIVPQTVTITVQPPFCMGINDAGQTVIFQGRFVNGVLDCTPPPNSFLTNISHVPTITQSTTVNVPVTTTQQICYRIPAACHNFKIADDQNARPQDRVFFDYNYYNNVDANFRLGTD